MKKICVKLLTAAALVASVGATSLTLASCNQQGGESSSSSSSSTPSIVVNSAKIDQENPEVEKGSTLQLTVTTDPAQLPVSWSSSNNEIATVSETGLVAGIGVGSCKITANIANGAATREVVLTVKERQVAGKISVDYDNLPGEIALGSKNALDLEQYVTVTKVDTWSLTTDSDTVQIDGHKVIGLALGDFSVTIVAGTTKRAITGKVVSENKLKFNAFIDSIGANLESYSSLAGYYMLADNYYASLAGKDTTTGKYVFTGSVYNKNDSKNYGFSINASIDDNDEVTFEDSATFNPGYAGGKDSEGITAFATSSSAFAELTDKGVPVIGADDDGNPYYVYTLAETSTSSTVISDFYSGIGAPVWSFLQRNLDATYAVVLYFPDSGVLNVVPANDGGLIGSFSYYGSTYSTTVMVSNVNGVKIPALEAWAADPVIPEQIDISPINTFFKNMIEKQTMTLEGYGQWTDGDGNNIDCPESMHFSDTEKGVFGNYSLKIAANATMYEQTVISMDDDYQYHEEVGESGTANVQFIENGSYKTVSGTYDAAEDAYKYDAEHTETEETSRTELWTNNTMLGQAFDSDVISKGVTLLDVTSFYEKTVNADNSTSYYFNTYGDDSEFGLSDGYNVGTMSMASMLLGTAGYYTSIWIQLQEWAEYVTNSFTLSEDGSKLTASFVFQVSSSIYYTWGYTISDVGTDNVSAAAKALLTPETTESTDTSAE